MAIKLYKSQLTPTDKSSNVENKAFISMSEAGSIGKAFKGMIQEGEKLYVKHQDIKSDNEVLEKSKEVMNGNDNFEGLSAVTLKASEMKDPDAALKYYNDSWQQIFDSSNGNLSPMAKKKFKTWMTKQNIKDANAIKVAATSNMIESLRTNKLDQIETLKKSIIYGTSLESETAKNELATMLSDKKTKELFGKNLDEVIKTTNRDVAFYQYKNVPITGQAAALAAAKKDNRLEVEDVQKLITHFKTAKTANNHLNKDNVSKMVSNMKNGYTINVDEYNTAWEIATTNEDQATLIKLKNIQEDAPIYAQLSTMSVAEIENRKNILTEYKNKNREGMELKYARNLEITTEYLAALKTSLDQDQLTTGNDRGIVAISEIGFEKLLTTGDVSEFSSSINERIAQAKTVAAFYKRPVQFFTANEKAAITAAFENATTSSQIINLSTALVKGFGSDSDTAFKQLSKDNTILAHIGGLVIMNDGVPGLNTKLAVKGYLISKDNPELSSVYKLKNTEIAGAVKKYSNIFKDNNNTFNNIIQAANYIYTAQLSSKGEGADNFKINDWEKAFKMAAGGSTIEKLGFDDEMGGFDKDTRGNDVHIPPWLENGKFENVVEMFNANKDGRRLFKKASSNGELPVVNGEQFVVSEIFNNQDPYFVSVGNGKYKIAMGENPNEVGADAEYLMNTDGGFFVIDLNLIKPEIITGLQ